MIIASNAFLELQHSFSTSPGMATGTVMLVRNRSRRSAFAIRISVDASKTIIMTKYDERNFSRKEMQIEEPKAFLTTKKSQQRLIVLTFNSSHWYCAASRGNHSVANRMLVAVQAVEN